MDTAVKVKVAMLEEHNKRPGEFGFNEVATRYFECEGDFFDAWADSWPEGSPTLLEEDDEFVIHKRFGKVYINDEGIPVACLEFEECSLEEAMKQPRR